MGTLLTYWNPKTAKGIASGWLTAVLHLAPANLSGRNVCPFATPACSEGCLNTAGRGGILKRGETSNTIQRARNARTSLFWNDRARFINTLSEEIGAGIRKASRESKRFAVRLNGTSDIVWETIAPQIFSSFPNVQFYDYTKIPGRGNKIPLPVNYHLTFSLAESNDGAATKELENGRNLAVVFRSPEAVADKVRAGFILNGVKYPVINGDESDLRFLDGGTGYPVIVALYAKGRMRNDQSGMVRA